MGNIRRIIIAAVLCILVIWMVALIKCELLTEKYYTDFENACQQNTMLSDIEYFKVLKCDGEAASVYYVAKGNEAGNIINFKREHDVWTEISWRTVWSKSGSASGVVYPYLWHFVYCGF